MASGPNNTFHLKYVQSNEWGQWFKSNRVCEFFTKQKNQSIYIFQYNRLIY